MAGNATAAPFSVRSTPVVGLAMSIVSANLAVTVFAANSIVNVADIENPPTASEPLYIDIVTTASAGSATSFALSPGAAYRISGPITTAATAVAATSGHAFVAVRY